MTETLRLDGPALKERARNIRRRILRMNAAAGQGHTGADLSETDILTALYFRILGVHAGYPDDPLRDRFVLSKGHGVGGFYCMLAEAGLIEDSLLDQYLAFDSLTPGHPVRQKNRFIELNTGALGHGLPVSVGLALGAKRSGHGNRVFVLLGDGELQEGSNWEAAMTAAHYKLDNLVVIVDRNNLQLEDRTETILAIEPLADKWRAFGFAVHELDDGNDMDKIVACLEGLDHDGGRPHMVLAHTRKGNGVSFIADQPAWHHRVPTEEELSKALEELN
ncbi:transketolase [Consotaella aegiceratis]|uniref:transketolase n=1 Tax=Consotaella aegiceratis TaxID=3097961 RepID=UPI002F421C06